MTIKELTQIYAESGLKLQEDSGCFKAGFNGPHNHKETPVRTTAHWLIIMLKALEFSQRLEFRNSAEKALKYLCDSELRPGSFTFKCRNISGIDKCNGLIGQAWVIEALSESFRILGSNEAGELAVEIFRLHPFNKKLGLWEIVDTDGGRSKTIYDLTVNHQIWFAACASMLYENGLLLEEDVEILNIFMDKLPNNIATNKNGEYEMIMKSNSQLLTVGVKVYIKTTRLYTFCKELLKGRGLLAPGYHAFHLYGLAILYKTFSSHEFFLGESFRKALNYSRTDVYRTNILSNKFGLHYNPPGIETAFVLERFANYFDEDVTFEIDDWINTQFQLTYNKSNRLMDGVKYDGITYASRFYELLRLNEYRLIDSNLL